MGDPQPFVERYEALRREALCRGTCAGAGQGMALVLHQGLTAWMHAWSRCRPPVSTPVSRNESTADRPSAPDLSSALVQALATMALAAVAAGCSSIGGDRHLYK